MLERIIGGVAAALLTALAMAWLARTFPPPRTLGPGPALEELAPRYLKWETLFVVAYMVSWAPVTYALWWLLNALSDLNAGTLGPAAIILTADPWFWALPAFFVALVLPGAPLTWLARRLLGPRFAEYERYLVLKHNMDYARANRLAFRVMGWGSALAVFLGLNWYVLVRDDALVVNRLLAVTEDAYPYAAIRSIVTAPKLVPPSGDTVSRREFLVTFADGATWSTQGLPREQTEEQKAALIRSVSERAGVPVEEIALFEKNALW